MPFDISSKQIWFRNLCKACELLVVNDKYWFLERYTGTHSFLSHPFSLWKLSTHLNSETSVLVLSTLPGQCIGCLVPAEHAGIAETCSIFCGSTLCPKV